MKGKTNLVLVSLLSLVGIVTSCGGTNVPQDDQTTTVDLKTVLNSFKEATSYDLTGDINFAIGTQYTDGLQTTTYSRSYAIEYNEASGGNIVSTTAYANFVEDDVTSVMQYSYDDNGDIEAGYIIDKGKTIQTSSKVDLGITSLTIPTALKDGATSYEITPELSRDKKLLESITTKAISGFKYIILKKLGTIESTVLTANEDGKGFTLTIKYATDEETYANGGSIVIKATNFNAGDDLVIKDYLEEGGQPKEISAQAKKLYNYAWSNCYASISASGTVGDDKKAYSYKANFIMNVECGYVGYIYEDGSTVYNRTANDDGTYTYTVEDAKSYVMLPIYGVSGLENNFYIGYVNTDGSIDLDLTDLSTFEDRAVFNSSTASSYFTSLAKMYSIMAYGNLGLPFLMTLSSINEEENLYLLGEYDQLTDDKSGFYSMGETMLEDMETWTGWDDDDTASYGELVGGAIAVEYGDTDEESKLWIMPMVYDSTSGYGFLSYRYYFTGFGSDDAKVTGADTLLKTLYNTSSSDK